MLGLVCLMKYSQIIDELSIQEMPLKAKFDTKFRFSVRHNTTCAEGAFIIIGLPFTGGVIIQKVGYWSCIMNMYHAL